MKLKAAVLVPALAICAAVFPGLLLSLDGDVRADVIVTAAGKDVPFVPIPDHVVEQILSLAQVCETDIVYDLGCGDGRIVVGAAKLGARGIGIDVDPERISDSNMRAQRENVTQRVKFIRQDMFETDFSEASVITLYLLPSINMKLRPKLLKQLKPGARIVSFSFSMGKWEPDKISGLVLYWVVPANVSGQWKWNSPRSGEQMTLELKQKFQKVKGALSIGKKTFPVKNAALSGNDLRFTAATNEAGKTTAEYRCSLLGDVLKVNTGPAGSEGLFATRTPGSQTDVEGSNF